MDTEMTAVKALSEDEHGVTIGGYLALWGDPQTKDLYGDYFTPETDLMLDHYKTAPCLFHHGLDSNVGLAVIGKRVEVKADSTGVFVKNWIDKSNRYWKMVEPLLQAGRLFYSPGSAPHLVKRAPDGKLLSFPAIEDTLTPIPAQYRLRPVEQIKAAYKSANIEMPETEAETAGAGAPDVEAMLKAIEADLFTTELSVKALIGDGKMELIFKVDGKKQTVKVDEVEVDIRSARHILKVGKRGMLNVSAVGAPIAIWPADQDTIDLNPASRGNG